VIKEILPSGDLVVAGEQLLEINNESQRISVEGRVRPQDVSDTNVVLSSRIANARIRYAGQGDLSDRQRPAWWQRFLTLFGV
jgi:flagellar L-ring protein precursor FlgH